MAAFMSSDGNKENVRPAEKPGGSSNTANTGNRIGPNGVILGPDGKPCKACNSLKAFGSIAAGASSGGKGKGKASAAAIPAGMAAAAAGSSTDVDPYKACPADVEQLGRHTWTFLHSTAAYYPDLPSPAHRQNAFSLFSSLPSLYPCRHCADELEVEMKRIGPPDVSSRTSISDWLCRIHNEVNARLGKREFDCSKVLQRWKDGWEDGRCD